ncbi:MAG: PilN domain-containing protein [Sedimentisphaerales bacterium]|nr:PilN domain-containing protein [Sedimentisphaerales bacterium]
MSNKVDFLPENYLEKKAQRRTNLVCLMLFLIVAVGVGTGLFLIQRRQSMIKAQADKINQEMVQASEALKQLEQLEEKKQEMMTKASISAMLMEPVPRSLLLATITNALPKGVSLVDYDMNCKEIVDKSQPSQSRNKRSRRSKKDEPKPEDVKPKKMETDIELTGLAPTDIEVAQFITNLNSSHLLSQVNLKLSEEFEYQEDIMRRFKLEVILDPESRASQKDVELARRLHVNGM